MTLQSDPDTYVQNVQNLIALFALLCAVSIIAGFFLLYQKEKEREENYFYRQQAQLSLNCKASRRMHHKLLSHFFYRSLNTPGVLEILSNVRNSSPKEIEKLQKRLYDRVFPIYKEMQNSGLFYLQFYDAEGDVFLRFHRERHYGDCLSIENPLIQKSITSRDVADGFEKGFAHGITHYFAFPLFWKGQYLGGVCMCMPSSAIVESLTELDPNRNYAFLLERDSGQSPAVQEISRADSYPLLALGSVEPPGKAKVFQTLALENKSIWKSLIAEKSVAVNGVVDGKTFTLCLLPIVDTDGFFIGYLASYAKNVLLDSDMGRSFFIIATGFVVLIFLLFLYLRFRWVVTSILHENQQLEMVCESFPEGLLFLDADGRIIKANPTAISLLGYQEKELMGKLPHDLFHHHTHNHVEQKNCPAFQAIQAARQYRAEELFRRKDGTFIPVDLFCRPIKTGGELFGTLFEFHDLTVRKDTEEQLRENEKLQRILMESMPVGLVIIDETTRVIEYVNPEAMNIFGLPEKNVVGNICHKFICPAEVDSCPISDLGQSVDNSERLALRRGKPPLPIRKTVRQIKIMGKTKMLECFIGVPAPGREKEGNHQASEQKKDFLTKMTYQILTPVNAILGMTRLLQDTELSDRQHSYLAKTHRAAKSLLGIINELLESSASREAYPMEELETAEFDLLDMLDNVLYVIGIRLSGKKIELTAGIDRNVPNQLKGDQQKLEKALIELAGNAEKFTEQGSIHIWVELDSDQGHDQGQDQAHPVRLKFSVQDTGTGIDPEKQKALARSWAADSGLNIVRRLVTLMGGTLGMESCSNQGSSFSFTLPFDGAELKRLAVDLTGYRVLIVEPKENSAKLLRERIAYLQGSPEVVQTGSQALEKLSEGGVQILITSKDLPDMSYRMLQEGYRKPTIVMTDMGEKAGPLNIGNGEIIVSRPLAFSSMVYGLRLLLTGSTAAYQYQIRENFAPVRVLVAEDNPINQRVAQELLQEIGLSVIVVSNGNECIEYLEGLENEEVALIFMDIQMPELNGFETARKIRSIPNMEDIPIVAMTAYATNEDRAEIFTAGMNDHLAKPIEVKEMIQVLKKWLPLSKERQNPEDRQKQEPPSSLLSLSSESDEQIINKKEALPRFANREDLFCQVLQKVAVDYGGVAEQLQAMLDADQMEEGRFLSHTLRGVMGNIGANQIFEISSRLEDCFSNGQKEEAADVIKILSSQIQKLVSHIQKIASCEESSAPQVGARPSQAQETHIKELAQLLAKHRPADCPRMLEIVKTIKTTEDNGLDIDQLIGFIEQYEFDKAMNLLSSVISQSESV